jgi:hypothetical protein
MFVKGFIGVKTMSSTCQPAVIQGDKGAKISSYP